MLANCVVLLTAALAPPPSATLQRLRAGGPGYAVVENFLSPAHVSMLKEDVSMLHTEARFAVAGVGEASTNRVANDVRRCEQCFLFPKIKHGSGGHEGARTFLYGVIDGLRDSLQRETGEALDGLLTEGLYAAYPQGGF